MGRIKVDAQTFGVQQQHRITNDARNQRCTAATNSSSMQKFKNYAIIKKRRRTLKGPLRENR